MSNVNTNKETTEAYFSERWAMGHVPSHLRLWLVVCVGLGADLWSKAWAFDTIGFQKSRTLVEGLCSFQLSLNPGALFGIGHGYAPIFVGASVLALMFVLYMFANSTISRWSMHIALGLVLAGYYDDMVKSFGVMYLLMIAMMMPALAYFTPSWDPRWLKFIPSYYIVFGFKEIFIKGDMGFVGLIALGYLIVSSLLSFLISSRSCCSVVSSVSVTRL